MMVPKQASGFSPTASSAGAALSGRNGLALFTIAFVVEDNIESDLFLEHDTMHNRESRIR